MRKKIRVAQYERVSHEDQKKFGSSIAAQRQHLNKFLDEHPEMVLIDEYCDEGISAVQGNNIFASNDPVNTEQHRIWFDEIGEPNWSEDEFRQLINFAKFLIEQRKGK